MRYNPKRYVILEKAPWTYDEVQNLNKIQNANSENPPYKCPEHGTKKVKLTATVSGFVCPERDCKYTQDYYYGEELVI